MRHTASLCGGAVIFPHRLERGDPERVREGLVSENFGYSADQADRRIQRMRAAFPEATTKIPAGLIEGIQGIPDPGDRHVVALAIQARAGTIVTDNLRHFPAEILEGYHLAVLSADDFMVHQYHLGPEVMLEKLDRQAAGIRKRRLDVLNYLQKSVPKFCRVCLKLSAS